MGTGSVAAHVLLLSPVAILLVCCSGIARFFISVRLFFTEPYRPEWLLLLSTRGTSWIGKNAQVG